MAKLVMTGKDMLALFNIEYEETLKPITSVMMKNMNNVLTLTVGKGDIETK